MVSIRNTPSPAKLLVDETITREAGQHHHALTFLCPGFRPGEVNAAVGRHRQPVSLPEGAAEGGEISQLDDAETLPGNTVVMFTECGVVPEARD